MNERLIEELKLLYLQIPVLRLLDAQNPSFKNWESKTLRTIKKLFGPESDEVKDFEKIQFWYMYSTRHYEKITKKEFDENNLNTGLDHAKYLLEDLIKDAEVLQKEPENKSNRLSVGKNVFISHSSKDHLLGKEVTNLLEVIGVPSSQIFNSSMPGYGVKPGEDWVETLKTTISSEGVVISLLSNNYYRSAVSLCEMGAAWVLSKKHYPLIIPPLTFRKVKGIIPTKHGIMINDSEMWSELKDELEKVFELTALPGAKWESRKKDILERIEKLLPTR